MSSQISPEELRDLNREFQNVIAAMRIEAPFFAHIVAGAKIRFTHLPDGIAALSRGKRTIHIDPAKFKKMKSGPRITTAAHEGLHLSLLHGLRRMGKDRARWQCAVDVVVNSLLESGRLLYTPPEPTFTAEFVKSLGSEVPEETIRRMSAEELYDILPPIPAGFIPCFLDDEEPDQDEEDSSGRDYSDPDPGDPQEYWRERVASAAVIAKQAGKLPAGIEWFVKEYLKVRTPWWAILQGVFNSGYNSARTTWRRLSRRYGNTIPGTIWKGPSVLSLIDCSGSISKEEQESYVGHLDRIVKDTMGTLSYLCWDAREYKMTPYRSGQAVKFAGGGGTTIAPVLQAALKLSSSFECLVILTDFYISDVDDDAVKNLFTALARRYDITVLASTGAQAKLPHGWKVLDIRETVKEAYR